MDKLISIIIPAINEAKHLAKLIPFLRENAGPHLAEIILVDGGSTDESTRIAQSAGAVVINSPVKRRSVQMNLGAEYSNGDILYFLHADTFPPPQFAFDIVTYFEQGFPMGCYRFKFDSDKWYLRINNYMTRFDFPWCRGGDQSLYVDKDIFNEFGGFREDYIIMEEYEFMEKARKKYPFKIMSDDILVSARKYEMNGYWKVQWANFIAFRKYRSGKPQQEIFDTYHRMLRHRL
jgi:rSAM/selenodomain-associated transferase 2